MSKKIRLQTAALLAVILILATLAPIVTVTRAQAQSAAATVTADALMARDGSQHLAWLLKLTYEDGHVFQLAGE